MREVLGSVPRTALLSPSQVHRCKCWSERKRDSTGVESHKTAEILINPFLYSTWTKCVDDWRKERGVLRIDPRISRTLSANHATRPNSRIQGFASDKMVKSSENNERASSSIWQSLPTGCLVRCYDSRSRSESQAIETAC